MSEIVVGTDGTAASREALLWSLEQAVRTGSDVTALFVWRIPLELEIPFDFETISSLREDLSRRDVSGFPQITAASLNGNPGRFSLNAPGRPTCSSSARVTTPTCAARCRPIACITAELRSLSCPAMHRAGPN